MFISNTNSGDSGNKSSNMNSSSMVIVEVIPIVEALRVIVIV